MEVRSINTNSNFGRFIKWNRIAELNYSENFKLARIKDYLDVKQSRYIDIIGEVKLSNPDDLTSAKRIRFITTPLEKDLNIIKSNGRSYAQAKDYERTSKWFSLTQEIETLNEIAADFLNRQIRYIKACTMDPNHHSTPIKKTKRH